MLWTDKQLDQSIHRLQIYLAYHLGWCHVKKFDITCSKLRSFERCLDIRAWTIVSSCIQLWQNHEENSEGKTIISCIALLENCLQIFDGMFWLQKLPKILNTFGIWLHMKLYIKEITLWVYLHCLFCNWLLNHEGIIQQE